MLKSVNLPISDKYKEHLYVLLLGVLVYLVIWLGYFLWQESQKINVWKLLPDTTLAVLETNSLNSVFHLENIFFEFLKERKNKGEDLTFLTVSDYVFDALRQTTKKADQPIQTAISLHTISKYDFGTVWYFKKKDAAIFHEYLQGLDTADFINKEERSYSGMSIVELRIKNVKQPFSYFEYKNQLICSSYPALLENIIRTIKSAKKERDYVYLNNKIQFKKFQKGEVSVFVKGKTMGDLVSLYLSLKELKNWSYVFDNQENIVSNVVADSTFIQLNGIDLPTSKNLRFIDVFDGQSRNDSSYLHLISQQAAYFFRLKFNDGALLKNDLSKFWESKEPRQYEAFRQLNKEFREEVDKLYPNFINELVFVQQATKNERSFFVQITNEDIVEGAIADLAKKAGKKERKKQLLESYGNYDIYEVEIPDLPSRLFGKMMQGFPSSYVTVINDYLVFATKASTLKKVIQAADNKSKRYNFSESLTKSKNSGHFTYFMDFFNSWSAINNNLNNIYKTTFSQKRKQFLQLNALSYIQDNVNKKFTFQIHKKENFRQNLQVAKEVYVSRLPSSSNTKPHLVRNHISQMTEVLLQDKTGNICLISENGKLLWKYRLDQKITGEVYQIDRYKNGFLQYTFVSGNKIHLIDRLGKKVNGYPIELPAYVQADNYAVIDFDQNKNYRYLVTDQNGNTFMSSIYGTILSNWSPRKFQYPLNFAPKHVRFSNKSVVVLTHKNGMINAARSNASLYNGFPLLFETEVSGASIIEKGNGFKDSFISFISREGELIKVSLEGKVVSRKRLGQLNSINNYAIIPDEIGEDSFVIVNQNNNNVEFLDREGVLIFNQSFTNPKPKAIQYFNFGSNVELIGVTDKQQQKTYLYHLNGDLLTDKPLNSSHEVSIKYNVNKRVYIIYLNYRNTSYCLRVSEG